MIDKLQKSYNMTIKGIRLKYTLLASFIQALAVLGVLVYGYEVFKNKISIGILVVFIQYCSRFITPFEKIIMLRVSINLIRPSLNRVNEIVVVILALWILHIK